MSGNKTVLIAGGSGFLGQSIAHVLDRQGYQIRILTRRRSEESEYQEFEWDLGRMYIDRAALEGVDVLINLAGASIGGWWWTKRRKQLLLDSRTKTNELLASELHAMKMNIETFIGTSGAHYYGDRGTEVLTENADPGEGFLSDLCQKWEDSQDLLGGVTSQLVKLRMGVVLGKKGGALPILSKTVIAGIGTYLGNGEQYMPWIHVKDVVQWILYILGHSSLNGVFNVVAPNPVTNKEFMRSIVEIKGGLKVLVPVPIPILKLILGEMSALFLSSAKVKPARIRQQTDFRFCHSNLSSALEELLI